MGGVNLCTGLRPISPASILPYEISEKCEPNRIFYMFAIPAN